jgi:hypothetical protein
MIAFILSFQTAFYALVLITWARHGFDKIPSFVWSIAKELFGKEKV